MPSPSSQGAFHTPVIGAATRGQSSQATVRTALAVAAGLLVASGVFVAFRPAYAGLGDIFALGIAWIFNIFTGWAGQLLLILVDWLIRIAQYNDFVNSAPVANGWSIVRDVTNMFFILVLLVIAFGTILGVDAYSYKNKMLSRLLIMAVVVNFSRTICGLLIDFAQVVMLTFVYGFKEAAGGNFADALRITRVMQARETIDSSQAGSSGDTISAWTIAVAMILAFFMVLISMFVIAMMIITLAIRIVYLWLLIVLSPLAFFLKAVPGGSASGYYGMWWKMFTSQVIVGPVMAFFLWLSLVSVASNNLTSVGGTGGGSQEQVSGAISAAFQSDEIGAFIMGLCLLMGGLQISKQISAESAGAAPGLAKKALSVGKAAAKRTVAGADRLTGGAIATGGVPIVSRWAGDARLARAQEKRQKESRAAAISETLSPTMKRAVANEFAFTEQGRANKAAVQRDLLKEAAKKPPKDAAGLGEVHQWRKDLRNTAEKAEAKKPGSGAAILKDLSEFEQKRPSLIIDKNETDPKEKARQEQSFRKSASGFNAARMADMDASELTEQFLAFANPKAIVKARETASGDQLTKLAEMGESETDIIAKQRQLRSQPENFALLSEQERAQQIKGMDKDQLAALASSPSIRPDHLQGEEVLKALASTTALSDGSTGLAQKVSVDLDYDKLRGNEDLARKIASGLDASAIGKLPSNVANELRAALGSGDPSKVLGSGGSVGQAFDGYDRRSGSFSTEAGRDAFAAFAQKNAGALAGSVSPDELLRGGGMNDVAMSVVSNIDAASLRNLAAQGKGDQVFGTIQAAENIQAADGVAALAAYQSQLKSSGVDQSQIDAMSNKFIDAMDAAKKNATEVLKNLSADMKLGGSMTFSGQAKAGAGAALSAAGGAIRSVPGAVGEGAKSIYRGGINAAKEANRAASDAFKEATERAATVKRKLGRLGKRL